jgi:aldose 1-epimerase
VSVWQREPWGTTREGEPVELLTFEQGAMRARFTNFGATLVSLEVPDRRGERADVVLGFDSLAEYESPRNPHFGGIVGRVANRIAGARFEIDGRDHVLAANEGKNHLHGGVCGFDRKVWAATLEQVEQAGGIQFRLRSPDGDEGYPGALGVSAIYGMAAGSRADEVHIAGLHVFADADAPTPCNLTQHAYFNLAGRGTILDHELQVYASHYLVVDDELLPTGEIASVAGTPYDFRAPRRIGERIAELESTPARGYDLCYVLDGKGAPAARLHDPASGRTLEVDTDQPGLQLYTGNRLDSLRGKRDHILPRFAGLCLETQGFPDAVHHPHFPSVVLRERKLYASKTTWLFSSR